MVLSKMELRSRREVVLRCLRGCTCVYKNTVHLDRSGFSPLLPKESTRHQSATTTISQTTRLASQITHISHLSIALTQPHILHHFHRILRPSTIHQLTINNSSIDHQSRQPCVTLLRCATPAITLYSSTVRPAAASSGSQEPPPRSKRFPEVQSPKSRTSTTIPEHQTEAEHSNEPLAHQMLLRHP